MTTAGTIPQAVCAKYDRQEEMYVARRGSGFHRDCQIKNRRERAAHRLRERSV